MRKVIAAVVLTAAAVTLAPASAEAMSICNRISCFTGR